MVFYLQNDSDDVSYLINYIYHEEEGIVFLKGKEDRVIIVLVIEINSKENVKETDKGIENLISII